MVLTLSNRRLIGAAQHTTDKENNTAGGSRRGSQWTDAGARESLGGIVCGGLRRFLGRESRQGHLCAMGVELRICLSVLVSPNEEMWCRGPSLRRTPESLLRRQRGRVQWFTAPVPALTARRRALDTSTQGSSMGGSQRQSAWSDHHTRAALVMTLLCSIHVCAAICGWVHVGIDLNQRHRDTSHTTHQGCRVRQQLIVYFVRMIASR